VNAKKHSEGRKGKKKKGKGRMRYEISCEPHSVTRAQRTQLPPTRIKKKRNSKEKNRGGGGKRRKNTLTKGLVKARVRNCWNGKGAPSSCMKAVRKKESPDLSFYEEGRKGKKGKFRESGFREIERGGEKEGEGRGQ